MKEKPNYYAIIPADVRYDDNLSANEKLLYGEISALSNEYGYCFATNGYFAKLYSVSNETVSRWISSLKAHNYVDVKLIKEGNQVKQRKITLLTKTSIPSPQKDQYPIDENVKDNNTSINITSNNIPTLSEVEDYFTENGYKKSVANDFWNYYNASVEDNPQLRYWRDAKGNKVKSWKQKARAVWFKEEHKIPKKTNYIAI